MMLERDRITVLPLGFDNLSFQMSQASNVYSIVNNILMTPSPIVLAIRKLIFQSHYSKLTRVLVDAGVFKKDLLLIKFSELYIMSCAKDDTYKFNINIESITNVPRPIRRRTTTRKLLEDLLQEEKKEEKLTGLVRNIFDSDDDSDYSPD